MKRHRASTGFPRTRMRRNRRHEWSRRLISENHLSVDDLIWPVFVIDGENKTEDVASMPDVQRYSVDLLVDAVGKAKDLGIPAVALFPFTDPSLKDAEGSAGHESGNASSQ